MENLDNLKQLLRKKWQSTGKIGFERVKSSKQAMELIDTIVQIYSQEAKTESVAFKDLIEAMREFLSD